MSMFFGACVSVPGSTATKLVDSAEVDRQVRIGGPVPDSLGFDSTEVGSCSNSIGVSDLILPAGRELWCWRSGSTVSTPVLVTPVGR